jgi:hypothetical protein
VNSEGRARLEFPGRVPPSLNAVAGRPNAAAWRRFKVLWGELIGQELIAAQARGELPVGNLDWVEAAGVIRFATRRERDEGNYRAVLEKALGDALVGDRRVWPGGHWLPDDTHEHFVFRQVAILVDPAAEPKTAIEFNWRKGRLL